MMENEYMRLRRKGMVWEKEFMGIKIKFVGEQMVEDEENVIRRLEKGFWQFDRVWPWQYVGQYEDGKWVYISDDVIELCDSLGEVILKYKKPRLVRTFGLYKGMDKDAMIYLGVAKKRIRVTRSFRRWMVERVIQRNKDVFWLRKKINLEKIRRDSKC